jgi:hypothetical protein
MEAHASRTADVMRAGLEIDAARRGARRLSY